MLRAIFRAHAPFSSRDDRRLCMSERVNCEKNLLYTSEYRIRMSPFSSQMSTRILTREWFTISSLHFIDARGPL